MDLNATLQVATCYIFTFQWIFLFYHFYYMQKKYDMYSNMPLVVGLQQGLLDFGDHFWAYNLGWMILFALARWWTNYSGLQEFGRAFFMVFMGPTESSFYQLYNEHLPNLIVFVSLQVIIAQLYLSFGFINLPNDDRPPLNGNAPEDPIQPNGDPPAVGNTGGDGPGDKGPSENPVDGAEPAIANANANANADDDHRTAPDEVGMHMAQDDTANSNLGNNVGGGAPNADGGVGGAVAALGLVLLACVGLTFLFLAKKRNAHEMRMH